MKKNIAILTLQGNANYGNRLQNYALEQVIQANFGNVTSLIVDNRPNTIKFLSWGKTQLKNLKQLSKVKQRKAKYSVFLPFSKNYLHVKKLKNFDSYDYVIVGSDQVWNPHYMRKSDKGKWFLDFIPQQKRLSYAASFGVTQIPQDSVPLFKKGLQEMKMISVREYAGIELVNELSGREAKLVADPTMLLTQNEWFDLINKQKESRVPKNKKYILIYILSKLSEAKRSSIKQFAQKNNLEILQIMGDTFDDQHHIYNPIEFIEAVANAEMIFTDSFHCTVFSIIFNSPFCVFERADEGTESRLKTLLSKFEFEEHLSSKTNTDDFQQIYDHTDFSKVPTILEKERKEGIEFLRKAID
ncbi:TPA: polysaccharide pyruvyl transferase family protein [Enterococcus faecium]|uniref:polysaccharide pyruvyl transferase family protein n=1 Tax=Enterococcus faecium TaxID=1352 RepID=UPI0023B26F17|nr:polysaccharide pyruvyl transferase family protein [Enterococcus faecium]